MESLFAADDRAKSDWWPNYSKRTSSSRSLLGISSFRSSRSAVVPATDDEKSPMTKAGERRERWTSAASAGRLQRCFEDSHTGLSHLTIDIVPGGPPPLHRSNTVDGAVCLIREGPLWILRTAESGNLAEFKRLFMNDRSHLNVTDSRGRTATHQAAAKNSVNILQFILNNGGDPNVQDNAGNTPLHVAILNDALGSIEFLLQSNTTSTSILNEKKQAPIHLITELNKVAALEIFGKFREKIDIQQGGEHGRTALHLAAINDFDECAKILITKFGACPRKPCNNGYYPIHEAAKNASAKTMEVFLQWGEAQGCPRSEMIAFYDSEGNVPLHSAVHGGDYKAVELCLKSGAKISKQQHDLSTPVHLACAQGAIEIVRLMFTLQPAEKNICLALCDVQKMTPLHCAAMFDHPEIVKYLIEEGAEMNCLDKESRSPLLLAASRTGWRTVLLLIRLGANILLKDANQRNVLALVVMNGGCLEDCAQEILRAQSESELNQLLNEKDNSGCSPLHYASREGHIRSLESLIKLGACINLKNNKNESPLHFAARYGRYNTCKQLLDSEKGTFIINESDGEGLTPLHISSKHGHTRVVQLLLNRGALLHRDHNGRNPLHLAAMSGYTQTMELLLSVHSHLLDQTDKDLNTALHLATMENKPNAISLLLSLDCKLTYNALKLSAIDYAIQYKFPDAALAMVTHAKRGQDVLSLKSEKYPCVTLALIAFMPKVFEAVQDNCITKANCKKDSKSFYVKYSFSCLQCPLMYAQVDPQTGETLQITNTTPLPALNAMVSHGRVELLAHPLSQKYLQMKWHSYGKYFHLTNLLFYTIFLIIVTAFAVNTVKHHWPQEMESRNESDIQGNFTQDQPCCGKSTMRFTIAICLITYVVLNTIREVMQMCLQKWNYLLDPSNCVSWLLYISAATMVFPEFLNYCYCDIQSPSAAITIFLSWFNLLLYLQRFDQVGIYVVMFLEILQTLLRVLLIFSILIIAFGLAFFILLQQGHHESFRYVPLSLLRAFTMMLEIDFVGTFVNSFFDKRDDKNVNSDVPTLPHPIVSFMMLVIFMVLMPILLMNLLIGLAVGDIESVRRNAQLKRLAMQVVLHTELERKLPMMFLDKVDKMEMIEFPNESKCKLGFMDKMLSKWFTNPFNEGGGVDLALDSADDYLLSEINKQKRRLKEIATALETQQLFLRLIVQKMEIKTEADDVDEGISPNDLKGSSSRWTSPVVNKKLRSVLSIAKGPY